MSTLRAGLLAGALLVATGAVPCAQAGGSVSGRALDSNGHDPLPGVTVSLTGRGLEQPLVRVALADGTFRFPRVPAGTYDVRFEIASFMTTTLEGLQVEPNVNASVDMTMEIGHLLQDLPRPPGPPRSISGKTSDSSGAPLEGVTVTVTGGALKQPLVAVTVANGTYQFLNVPVGGADVKFERPGFMTAIRQGLYMEDDFAASVNMTMLASHKGR